MEREKAIKRLAKIEDLATTIISILLEPNFASNWEDLYFSAEEIKKLATPLEEEKK